jgi:tetratricopeptide (TPR) repeat protein
VSQSDFVSRGQALVAAGQFQEAVKVCRLGLLGRPTTVEGRVVLGQALLALKRFDEVLAEMRVALELDHSSLPAQVLRAEALLRKGDTAPAIEALHKALQAAPGDQRILELLGQAEHGGAPSRASVTHPAVGFVGAGDTKHYVGHTSGSGDESSGPEYTRPTSIASPTSRRQSAQRDAASERTEMTPPPAMLDVGDKSGTVEVDPELEGIEVDNGDPDDVVAPPPGKRAAIGGPRGAISASSKASSKKAAAPVKKAAASSKPASTMPLDIDEDLEEMAETVAPGFRQRAKGAPLSQAPAPAPAPLPGLRPPGPGTAVRNAVAMPSGIIGDFSADPPGGGGRGKGKTVPPPFSQGGAGAPRPNAASVPPPFGQVTMPPAPLPPAPRSPIAAALPTVAAAQPPPPFVQQQAPYPPTPASLAAAQRPTMAVDVPGISTELEHSAAAVDQLFGNEGPAPAWAQSTMAVNPNVDPRSIAAAHEPTARPGELDPQILALMSGGQAQYQQQQMMMQEPPPQLPSHLLALDHVSMPMAPHPMRTGVRKSRSKLAIALWVVVGVLVIGGGVFAGFKIRAMRLDKKIAAARQQANDLAKTDTYAGWTAARDSLSSIVGASSTVTNRAALARTRAQIAYEFSDGVPEAKTAVEQLSGQGGLDGRIAVAFEALSRGDTKAAKTASDAAVAGSDADATAQYVAGEAALLGGNAKVAVAAMKMAADKDPRPLFGVGLARAYAAAYNWEEAIAAIDRVLAGSPDHPGAVIVRANILASSGRIFPGSALGNEVKQQVEHIILEGKKTGADDKRLVAPMQLALAQLALARVELARGDLANAKKAVRGATDVNIDDARFAEETIDTLYTLGELALARTAAEISLKLYPSSMRVRIGYAEVMLAQGRANEAIDTIGKELDALALPDALAVRGAALLAIGDTVGAAADFDAALKVVPTHEPAIVGRTWQLLAAGDLDAAAKPIAERMSPKGASVAVQIAYAATLRRSADAAQRDQAKALLEKIVASPAGPEGARAHLELARIYRDAGDFTGARAAYEKATRNGSAEARLESALVLIEYSKPVQGRELLETLMKESGDKPTAQLVVETARARMLVGEHLDAGNLLALADKMSSVERWKLDRERGRLALRKSDFTGAATALSRALDGCGGDAETFLLAADAATADKALADKVRQLAPERLKGRPEAQIVAGKLLIAADKRTEAETVYKAAKQALRAEKASNRRLAQADFGLAVIEYYRPNLAVAQSMFELVMQEDPTIVDTYIFASEMASRDKKKAYDFAQTAARYNPDYAYAWLVVGKLAFELKDKRTLADAIARLSIIAPTGDELKELQKLRGG